MNARFNPRKKKVLVIDNGPKKTVRIDRNTQVLVSINMSDEEARERLYLRHKAGQHAPKLFMKPLIPDESHPAEIPIGSMEELGVMVENMEGLSEIE